MIDQTFRPRARAHGGLFPAKYKPMLMSAERQPFSRDGWIFEPKLDGMRAIAIIDGSDCRLLSRNGLDFAGRYRSLAQQLLSMGTDVVLDGEIVCLDQHGKPNFEQLQERIRMNRAADIARADVENPVYFYVFDILSVRGSDCMNKRLSQRKALLQQIVFPNELIRHTPFFDRDGISLYQACLENGLEGIVGKRLDSRYECGQRSKSWVKVKILQTADVIIAGHKPDVGFLVGCRTPEGKLAYVGSVIGGLRGSEYDYLQKRLRVRQACPFDSGISRWQATWFEPEVVAEVRFMLWTSGGFLRLPAFTRLRADVHAEEVMHPFLHLLAARQ